MEMIVYKNGNQVRDRLYDFYKAAHQIVNEKGDPLSEGSDELNSYLGSYVKEYEDDKVLITQFLEVKRELEVRLKENDNPVMQIMGNTMVRWDGQGYCVEDHLHSLAEDLSTE